MDFYFYRAHNEPLSLKCAVHWPCIHDTVQPSPPSRSKAFPSSQRRHSTGTFVQVKDETK